MKFDKESIVKTVKRLKMTAKQHSPEILAGVGIAGMVTTVVMAVRATPKALAIIDEKEIDEGRNLTRGEKVKAAWTCYVPTALVGATSVACLVGSTSVSIRRQTALAAAYSIAETSLKEYSEKTLELVGEKKERAIRDAVAKDRIEKDPVENKEVIVTATGDTRCYDMLSGRYFRSDMESIRRAVNDLNKEMRSDGYISLNDFYYHIGLPMIQVGNYLGWNIQRGEITEGFSTHLAPDGTPCLVVEFSKMPVYDFDKLSLD